MVIHLSFLISELTGFIQNLLKTKQLHAVITKSHLFLDPFFATGLVRLYGINNDIHSARNLFDRTPRRSVYLWNSIIRAYARASYFDEAFCLFKDMLQTRTRPDCFTYACLIRACSESFDLRGLRFVHGAVIVSGLSLDTTCSSALVMSYSKLGHINEASKVFCKIDEPDLVLWNTMISGCGYRGSWEKGLQLFQVMRGIGSQPDGYTLVGLISCLVNPSLLGVGQGIHGLCLKGGLECSAHIGSALVSMYSRCGCMTSAYKVFSNLSQPDLVSWSALITGSYQSGNLSNSLFLFRKMNLEGMKADPILIASVLAITAQLAHMGQGMEIHGYVLRHGFESEVKVSSALVDMYSKCGFLGQGIRVFEAMPQRNIVSYNSLISGFGLHGLASEAFRTFDEIIKRGFKPDKSTFSALLCACCHAGLVENGRDIFKRMTDEFHVEATTEHYVYMVKVLGIAGQLKDAYKLIQSLPEPVDSGILGALLSCCQIQGNLELANIVAKKLFENEPEKDSYKVILSNICASDGRWDDVEKLRDNSHPDSELRKLPGLSWIGGCGAPVTALSLSQMTEVKT